MNNEIMTTEDIETLSSDIQTALDALYKQDGMAEVMDLHPLVKEILMGGDKDVISDNLKQLEQDLSNYETLNVSIPFVPGKELVRKVCNWVERNLGKKIVLSLTYDSTLLGGCTLSYNGRYLDHSLKSMVDDYFSKREKI